MSIESLGHPLNVLYYQEMGRAKDALEEGPCSESSTSSTTASSGGIGWDWGDILNSTDLESVTGESSDGRLGTWTNGSGAVTTSTSQLDVHGVDTDISECLAHIDSGKHS